MRNWHPIWFMRYVFEEFPFIIHDYIALAIMIIGFVVEGLAYLIQLLNVTIYNRVVLLFSKDNNLSE